jgi:hypothetical protein
VVGEKALRMGVDRHVRRVLRASRKGSIENVRVFPNFTSFEEGSGRPIWWQQVVVPDSWGKIFGVHENEPGALEGSIVIAEQGLAVLQSEQAAAWVPYDSIDRWDGLSKDPVSRALVLWTMSGERIVLPFNRGGAFAFVQFLGGAIREQTSK